jgi:hypothetical protein
LQVHNQWNDDYVENMVYYKSCNINLNSNKKEHLSSQTIWLNSTNMIFSHYHFKETLDLSQILLLTMIKVEML